MDDADATMNFAGITLLASEYINTSVEGVLVVSLGETYLYFRSILVIHL
jgi:hypothetical protein